MINKHILKSETIAYINTHLNEDIHKLLLKKSPFPEVSMQEIVQQIKGKKIAKKKLPFLYQKEIVFPHELNLEQSSSETTALFKSKNIKGKRFLDLTCGFGIDAYFMSKNFEEIHLVDQNRELLEMVDYNWKILRKRGIFYHESVEIFLQKNQTFFDYVYLDPSRRDIYKNKKFLLQDLSPNILNIQEKLLNISKEIIIKLSPMIDISSIIRSLRGLYKIQIIAVKNEVKEVLVFLRSEKTKKEIPIECHNLKTEEPCFSFIYNHEKSKNVEYSPALRYIYIPNNAILKSGGFKSLAKEYQLKKLHPNTHIYTSSEKKNNFCGRVLKCISIDTKRLKKGSSYNIISKNHPLSPDEIRKKYDLKNSGDQYLIFTQSLEGKIILESQLTP